MVMRPRVVRRRPLLRAAAIGGTFAAGRAMGKRAQEQQYDEASQNQPAGQGEPPPAQAHVAGETSVMEELSRLAAMHDQGALTDAEFAAAKAKVLGG